MTFKGFRSGKEYKRVKNYYDKILGIFFLIHLDGISGFKLDTFFPLEHWYGIIPSPEGVRFGTKDLYGKGIYEASNTEVDQPYFYRFSDYDSFEDMAEEVARDFSERLNLVQHRVRAF